LSSAAAGYRAPKWLPGGHAQTIYPLLIKPQPYPYLRERWETPDDDFIDLDWNATATRPTFSADSAHQPLVVLFHGLEGSSNSHYARTMMHAMADIGWDGIVVHFRGCSGEPNRLPRAYHSGDSVEVDWILRRLKTRFSTRPLYAVGFSLGGNALLKWLGEQEASAQTIVEAAAAISAPFDLAACGHHLARGFNHVYTRYFLNTLKPASAARLQRFPGLFDAARMGAASNLWEFDDAVTGPVHGFAGADDYWARSSAKPFLKTLAVPALAVNPKNDPFLPARFLPRRDEVSACVRLEHPEAGGHVGFVSGPFPGKLDWLPQRLLHFFTHEITSPPP